MLRQICREESVPHDSFDSHAHLSLIVAKTRTSGTVFGSRSFGTEISRPGARTEPTVTFLQFTDLRGALRAASIRLVCYPCIAVRGIHSRRLVMPLVSQSCSHVTDEHQTVALRYHVRARTPIPKKNHPNTKPIKSKPASPKLVKS